ncbi:MAG: hypothetical protein PUG86_00850 [Veillonella caviae]|nr:hypothetical protein [Veillonella caviae]
MKTMIKIDPKNDNFIIIKLLDNDESYMIANKTIPIDEVAKHLLRAGLGALSSVSGFDEFHTVFTAHTFMFEKLVKEREQMTADLNSEKAIEEIQKRLN